MSDVDEIEQYAFEVARAQANLYHALLKQAGNSGTNGATEAAPKKRPKPESNTTVAAAAPAKSEAKPEDSKPFKCECAKSGIRGGAECPTPHSERNDGKSQAIGPDGKNHKYQLCKECAKWWSKARPKQTKADGAGAKKKQKKISDLKPAATAAAAKAKEPSEDEEERANQIDRFEGDDEAEAQEQQPEQEEEEDVMDEDELGVEVE